VQKCRVHTLLRLPTDIWYSPGVKGNVIFFDKKAGRAEAWTDKLWVYDLRTNQHFTLKQKPKAIRQIVILDNIGLSYNGINIALSDSATVGKMDGEILISFNKRAQPDTGSCRRFAARTTVPLSRIAFFQPTDVDQVLNFGLLGLARRSVRQIAPFRDQPHAQKVIGAGL
jgi:hypothetical protein